MRSDLVTIRCGPTIVTMSKGPIIVVTMSRGPTANMDRGLTNTTIRQVRRLCAGERGYLSFNHAFTVRPRLRGFARLGGATHQLAMKPADRPACQGDCP